MKQKHESKSKTTRKEAPQRTKTPNPPENPREKGTQGQKVEDDMIMRR